MSVRQSFQQLLISFLVLLLLCAKPGLGNTPGKVGCIEGERQALLQFKHGLADDYGILSSWGDQQDKRDCCQWRGIRCSNVSGHVISLHLPAPPIHFHFKGVPYLRGQISPSVLVLEQLTHLDLSYNDFEGRPIPPFLGSLRNLQYLNLCDANFSEPVPTQLGNLSSLLSLDLSFNDDVQFGELEWLSHLSSLRFLDLCGVDLGAAIHWSQSINNLPSLIHLNLNDCNLPPFIIGSLYHANSSAPLVFLDLSFNNRISSSIFPWLFNLSASLSHLDLSSNNLDGSIPEYFWNITSLTYLDLFNNQLGGGIPDTIANLASLTYLDLSANQLTALPKTIGRSLVYVDISMCQLKGPMLNTFSDLVFLENLDLSDNNIEGDIPKLLGRSLVNLDLARNRLQGSIPDSIGKMVSLEKLDLSRNQFQGGIPDAIGDLSSLTTLQLSYNELTTLPRTVGSSLVQVDISFNQLNDSIPNAFDKAVSLKGLLLSSNKLQGEIPASLPRSLVTLDLTSNQLHGSIPDTIGNMASLDSLLLSLNQLQGEIPKSLSNLCNLEVLELDSNDLTGSIPKDFLACANSTLRVLSLSHNQLSGTLPESIGQLSNLQLFDIGSNSLQGAISGAHFLNLSNLYNLDLSYNSLTFNMSSDWVPPFQLSFLLLASCKLGPPFPRWLQNQMHLSKLDLSNSNISDVLPDWFWNITQFIRALNISNNKIRGRLPNLSSKFDYMPDIDLSSNYLEGSIPQLPSTMFNLDLSNNKLSGSISSFCAVTNSYLASLDLSNNLLTGSLPNCWSQLENLEVLNLENNKFFGRIPSSIGSLHLIRTLHLRSNNFTGEVPLSLKNCSRLRFIDFGKNRLFGRIPSWIGESLPYLTILSLQSNKFSGSICSELCQLKKIQILDLSSNDLSSVIPKCLNNLTAMTMKGSLFISYNYSHRDDTVYTLNSAPFFRNGSYVDEALLKWKGREFEYRNILGLVRSIDLSSNNLVGGIPKEITDLVELVSLNLSRNYLTGSIPTTIGQLKSLEILDLSQNQLSDEIPSSLSEISSLCILDLSENNLLGKIPQGTQLQSFSIDSYKGNPGLCGLPLIKRCPQNTTKQDSSPCTLDHDIQENRKDMWLFISIALGFIVGFWGVCGTLILNSSWRYTYFHFLNEIKDWCLVIVAIHTARAKNLWN